MASSLIVVSEFSFNFLSTYFDTFFFLKGLTVYWKTGHTHSKYNVTYSKNLQNRFQSSIR